MDQDHSDARTDLEATHCTRCGAELFKAVPHHTTVEDIVAFARTAKLQDAEQIVKDGWIHPGIYCPNGCTAIMINYKSSRTDTNPLVRAAREDKKPGRVRKLLDQGADVNGTDEWENTALHESVRQGHSAIVRLLLERGADVHKSSSDADVPVRLAAETGNAEIVSLLVEYGADVHLGLWAAAGRGHKALVESLLQQGANINAICHNYTVLMKAIAHSQLETARFLLNHGVNVNQQTETGSTALIRATEQNHPPMVRLLLENGADVNLKDTRGRTALYFALRYQFTAVADLLREAGAE